MEKFKGWFLALLGILAGAFLFERSKRQKAESGLLNAEYNTKDQLLKQDQDRNTSSIEEQKQKIKDLEKQHANETNQDLTPEQVQEYWKKRNNPSKD